MSTQTRFPQSHKMALPADNHDVIDLATLNTHQKEVHDYFLEVFKKQLHVLDPIERHIQRHDDQGGYDSCGHIKHTHPALRPPGEWYSRKMHPPATKDVSPKSCITVYNLNKIEQAVVSNYHVARFVFRGQFDRIRSDIQEIVQKLASLRSQLAVRGWEASMFAHRYDVISQRYATFDRWFDDCFWKNLTWDYLAHFHAFPEGLDFEAIFDYIRILPFEERSKRKMLNFFPSKPKKHFPNDIELHYFNIIRSLHDALSQIVGDVDYFKQWGGSNGYYYRCCNHIYHTHTEYIPPNTYSENWFSRVIHSPNLEGKPLTRDCIRGHNINEIERAVVIMYREYHAAITKHVAVDTNSKIRHEIKEIMKQLYILNRRLITKPQFLSWVPSTFVHNYQCYEAFETWFEKFFWPNLGLECQDHRH